VTARKPAPSSARKFTGIDNTGRLVSQLEDRVASRRLGAGSEEEFTADNISAALALAGVAFTHDCPRSDPDDPDCPDPRHLEDEAKLAEALEPITPEIRAAGFGGHENWPARRALLQAFREPPGTPLTASRLGGGSPGGREAARAGLEALEGLGYLRKTGTGVWVRPAPKARKGER
jgi:hypothetical protein